MLNPDRILQAAILLLITANVWVLLSRNGHESTCGDNKTKKSQDVAARSQCDASFLPDKCTSLLNGVDMNTGLVLGKQKDKKVFLTVGVAVWDNHLDNIGPILSSLISHMTQEDTSDVIIVVSVNQEHASTVQRLLDIDFRSQVNSGLIHLVSPTPEYIEVLSRHPPIGDVYYKEFSKGFIKRVIKFNKVMGFLLFYSHSISDFVLHISDQTTTESRFLPEIKNQTQTHLNSNYFALDFSDLNLYPSSVLQRFTEFFAMFGLNASPAIIHDYRYVRQSRSHAIETNTRMFSAKIETAGNKRPNGTVTTSLATSDMQHTVDKAYSDENGFFWSTSPKQHDYVQVTFEDSINLSRVLVQTGSVFLRDTLSKAVLMVCPRKEQTDFCDLDNCTVLATFGNPIQDLKNLENIVRFPVKCLRIEFTGKLDSWVIIRDISVWTI